MPNWLLWNNMLAGSKKYYNCLTHSRKWLKNRISRSNPTQPTITLLKPTNGKNCRADRRRCMKASSRWWVKLLKLFDRLSQISAVAKHNGAVPWWVCMLKWLKLSPSNQSRISIMIFIKNCRVLVVLLSSLPWRTKQK